MLTKPLKLGLGALCIFTLCAAVDGAWAENKSGPSISEMERMAARKKASQAVMDAVEKAEARLEAGEPYAAKVILMRLRHENELSEADYAIIDPVAKKVDEALGEDQARIEREIQKKLEQEKETSQILSEYRKRQMVQQELERKKAEALVEQARVELYQENHPEKAAELARQAMALDAENDEAEKLLTEARVMMGKPDAELKKQANILAEVPRVTLESLKQKYQSVKEEARKLYEQGEYEEAAAKWRRAQTYVNVLSVYTDMQTEKELVEKELNQAEKRAEEADRQLAERRKDEAREKMEEAVQKVEAAEAEKEAAALDRAWKLIREQRYEEARKIVQELKYQDPASTGAQVLDEVLTRRMHEEEMDDILWKTKKEKLAILRKNYKQAIPYAKAVNFPEKKVWQDVIGQRAPVPYPSREKRYTEEERKVVENLDMKVNLAFDETPLPQVVEFLQEVTPVNFSIHRQDLPPDLAPITLHIETSLRNALDEITDLAGMCWKVDGPVIKIANCERLKEYELRVYDIRDLLLNTEDKRARRTATLSEGDWGDDDDDFGDDDDDDFGGGWGGDDDDDGGAELGSSASESLMRRANALRQLIMRTVAPDTWATGGMIGGVEPDEDGEGGGDGEDLWGGDGGGGGGGGFGGGGFGAEGGAGAQQEARGRAFFRGGNPGDLIIMQTAGVHSEIEALLRQLREAMYIQVNIETRFVQVDSQFFQEVGFDWSKIDVDYEKDEGPIRVEDDDITLNTGIPVFGDVSDLGLDVNFTVFDSVAIEGFFRALQTRSDTKTLSTPTVTLMNGQRGYILVETTQNFISGWDTSEDTDEPEIDTIAETISLDVRPIVSSDRRYVYLELAPLLTGSPTFEEFSWTITTDEEAEQEGQETEETTSTRTIELPKQLAESLEVTVCVPDRGVLLIGGLTSNDIEDRETGVPVLSKIPVVKRLFTAEGQSTDRETLLILVRPRIILMNEEENQAF